MHKLTFYPLGNADTCRIDLANGRTLLFDYANVRCTDDRADKRADLPTELRTELDRTDRNDYDVVVFTHLDNDHVCGASEFFHFDHATKYQTPGRVKIKELWVPATAIYDGECVDDARVIREEARYRLKNGYGVRVFSRPERLREWLESQGLTLESRRGCIVDAGNVIPGFTLPDDEVEFFLHSPHAYRTDEGDLIDRNGSSIVVQGTFSRAGRTSKLILAADVTYETLNDIVDMSRRHGNYERLEWDVFKLPHHASYTAIGPDRGKDVTSPTAQVAWLYDQGRHRGVMVSSSRVRHTDDSDIQPPHRQAVAFYEGVARKKLGELTITMEHPTSAAPKPMVVRLDGFGATLEKALPAAAASLASTSSPRAG